MFIGEKKNCEIKHTTTDQTTTKMMNGSCHFVQRHWFIQNHAKEVWKRNSYIKNHYNHKDEYHIHLFVLVHVECRWRYTFIVSLLSKCSFDAVSILNFFFLRRLIYARIDDSTFFIFFFFFMIYLFVFLIRFIWFAKTENIRKYRELNLGSSNKMHSRLFLC